MMFSGRGSLAAIFLDGRGKLPQRYDDGGLTAKERKNAKGGRYDDIHHEVAEVSGGFYCVDGRTDRFHRSILVVPKYYRAP